MPCVHSPSLHMSQWLLFNRGVNRLYGFEGRLIGRLVFGKHDLLLLVSIVRLSTLGLEL
jgi:hypothetical protein